MAGVKDRDSLNVVAQSVSATEGAMLREFVLAYALPDASLYSDEAKTVNGLPRRHYMANHSTGAYLCGYMHTNGIVFFWSVFKRGYHGTFHLESSKHLGRYVAEFCGRQNARELDTIVQMSRLFQGLVKKRLAYR